MEALTQCLTQMECGCVHTVAKNLPTNQMPNAISEISTVKMREFNVRYATNCSSTRTP